MSDIDEIRAIKDRMRAMESEATRALAAQTRATGDDTHYFKASLQHYTDWLIVNGYIDNPRDTVGAYLDAMNGRSWPRRSMRKVRRVLDAVRRANP